MQVVNEINTSSEYKVESEPTTHLNHNKGNEQASANSGCLDDEKREFWNETTLLNVAEQYSMDVVNFG